jgi:DNA-binding MarR family transcriptional regulator
VTASPLPHPKEARDDGQARHPEIGDIRDLLTFRIAMLAATNDRVGQSWLWSDFGLRILEWRVIGLTAAMEPVRFGTIARRLLVDKGQLSRLVKGLVERGLIQTAPDDEDQRTMRISMTEAGLRLHRKALDKAFARNDRIVSAMTRDETQMLFQLLDKLQPLMDHRVDEVEKHPGI